MRRRHHFDPKEADRRVDMVLRLGYYVVAFSLYHVRIQDAVDLWPGSMKWFDLKGPGGVAARQGVGFDSLKARLLECYPLKEAAA